MKTLKRISILVMIASVLTTFSCTKEGKEGPPGPAGTNGTNGTNGNANVIGTNTVTLNSGDWSATGAGWYVTLTASGITQDVVDKGIVQVFIQYGTEWWSLPDLSGINSTQFGFGLGYVQLLNYNSDYSQATNPGTKTFRIVIIPSSARLANPNIDYTNYNEVKRAFNLKD
jgi:hypothetical protein